MSQLTAVLVDSHPLFRTGLLQANHEYYVQVRASARPRNSNFLWPWTGELSGSAKFTFIR